MKKSLFTLFFLPVLFLAGIHRNGMAQENEKTTVKILVKKNGGTTLDTLITVPSGEDLTGVEELISRLVGEDIHFDLQNPGEPGTMVWIQGSADSLDQGVQVFKLDPGEHSGKELTKYMVISDSLEMKKTGDDEQVIVVKAANSKQVRFEKQVGQSIDSTGKEKEVQVFITRKGKEGQETAVEKRITTGRQAKSVYITTEDDGDQDVRVMIVSEGGKTYTIKEGEENGEGNVKVSVERKDDGTEIITIVRKPVEPKDKKEMKQNGREKKEGKKKN